MSASQQAAQTTEKPIAEAPGAKLPAVELRDFNHIAMQTTDVARLTAFYQDVLGFRRLRRPFDGVFTGAWLGGGGTMIHIMSSDGYAEVQKLHARNNWVIPGYQAPTRPPPEVPQKPVDGRLPLEDHLAFVVNDIRATRRRLRALGVECFNVKDDMQNHLWILDPDGRIIELTVDTPWPPFEDEQEQAVASRL
mmetsp:Transcript_11466/g.24057  ORF Transcript_11466/g.24057 Transcript_11466/m.24057 type:complete len:193 (+) Transcript_11466:65-643(+)